MNEDLSLPLPIPHSKFKRKKHKQKKLQKDFKIILEKNCVYHIEHHEHSCNNTVKQNKAVPTSTEISKCVGHSPPTHRITTTECPISQSAIQQAFNGTKTESPIFYNSEVNSHTTKWSSMPCPSLGNNLQKHLLQPTQKQMIEARSSWHASQMSQVENARILGWSSPTERFTSKHTNSFQTWHKSPTHKIQTVVVEYSGSPSVMYPTLEPTEFLTILGNQQLGTSTISS